MIREAEENPYMSMSDVIDPPLHLTISLPGSTPLRSFLGGVCAAFPVHALLYFNNNTFGISSFIHGAAPGRLEDFSVWSLVAWPLQSSRRRSLQSGILLHHPSYCPGCSSAQVQRWVKLAVTFHAGTHVIHLLTMHR
jgi:hypothetical protein